MADDTIRLTYRELADRLGLSLDAAKMKARRAAKGGQWKIVPGNYPNAPVSIEVPTAAITRAVTTPPERRPEQTPVTAGGDEGNSRADALLIALEQLTPLTEHLMTASAEANARVDQLLADNRHLTSQLVETKDQFARISAELAAAETRELGTKAELERAVADVSELRRQIERLCQPWWRKRRW